MSSIDTLTKAISAHARWKKRLNEAIASGQSHFTVATVGQDDQCDFGRWLRSLPSADQGSEEAKRVWELHIRFHKEAATTLGLALDGKQSEALERMKIGGNFANASASLTLEMMAWRKKLPG